MSKFVFIYKEMMLLQLSAAVLWREYLLLCIQQALYNLRWNSTFSTLSTPVRLLYQTRRNAFESVYRINIYMYSDNVHSLKVCVAIPNFL